MEFMEGIEASFGNEGVRGGVVVVWRSGGGIKFTTVVDFKSHPP